MTVKLTYETRLLSASMLSLEELGDNIDKTVPKNSVVVIPNIIRICLDHKPVQVYFNTVNLYHCQGKDYIKKEPIEKIFIDTNDETKAMKVLSEVSGIKRLLLDDASLRKLLRTMSQYIPDVFNDLINLTLGDDPGNHALTNLPLIFSSIPVSESLLVGLHYAQILHTKSVKRFDYGMTENLERYSQTTPPLYDLGVVDLPVFLLYGPNDKLCHIKDVTRLFDELGSTVKDMIEISKDPYVPFNHLNFLYANNLTLLYSQIFAKIDELHFLDSSVSNLSYFLDWILY